jgi:hypothetical protein
LTHRIVALAVTPSLFTTAEELDPESVSFFILSFASLVVTV